jgi:hypothetical protein
VIDAFIGTPAMIARGHGSALLRAIAEQSVETEAGPAVLMRFSPLGKKSAQPAADIRPRRETARIDTPACASYPAEPFFGQFSGP